MLMTMTRGFMRGSIARFCGIFGLKRYPDGLIITARAKTRGTRVSALSWRASPMGLVCQLVFTPVFKLVHVIVTVVEFILVQVCRLIQELVNVITEVLTYVCNTVVHTVCSAVCSVVCNTVTEVVCGWTYILQTVAQWVTRLVCNYILQAILKLLDIIVTFVEMVLTWICTLIDIIIRWILCWTYLGDIFNNTKPRRFRVAPKIIRNKDGYSDWFVYVNNPGPTGAVDQNVQGYILSDQGRPLVPVVDPNS